MPLTTADLARNFFDELWNQRKEDAVDRLTEPGSTCHLVTGEVVCADVFLDRVHRPFLDAFPDLKLDFEDVLANGDQAVVRWHLTGTHLGDGLGMPATGQPVDVHGMTWLVFRDGKVVDGFDAWDQGSLFQKLSTPAAAT